MREMGPPRGGLVALLYLQAWVWTASVLPKITSTAFVSGFAGFVGAAHSHPAVYARVLGRIVHLAPSLIAASAVAVEVGLALTFVGGLVALLRHRGRLPGRLALTIAAASLLGAVWALNLALLDGDPTPWTLGDPFDSGVAFEYLLAGLGLASGWVAFLDFRRVSRTNCPT